MKPISKSFIGIQWIQPIDLFYVNRRLVHWKRRIVRHAAKPGHFVVLLSVVSPVKIVLVCLVYKSSLVLDRVNEWTVDCCSVFHIFINLTILQTKIAPSGGGGGGGRGGGPKIQFMWELLLFSFFLARRGQKKYTFFALQYNLPSISSLFLHLIFSLRISKPKHFPCQISKPKKFALQISKPFFRFKPKKTLDCC